MNFQSEYSDHKLGTVNIPKTFHCLDVEKMGMEKRHFFHREILFLQDSFPVNLRVSRPSAESPAFIFTTIKNKQKKRMGRNPRNDEEEIPTKFHCRDRDSRGRKRLQRDLRPEQRKKARSRDRERESCRGRDPKQQREIERERESGKRETESCREKGVADEVFWALLSGIGVSRCFCTCQIAVLERQKQRGYF